MARTPRQASGALHLAESYTHYDTEALARPEVGTQAQFRKKRPPKKYRYDPTLDPELAWNEAPVDHEVARLWDRAVNATTLEEAKSALQRLNQIAAPSLRWAGKAERPEFSVPTLPLFVHERLSTKAILETLKGHKRDKQMAFDMFGDAQLPLTDRVLKAYEHKDRWVNRMILGDSLQVMNSLLEYESLGGQVQMIYMDPPYGVKFGSNFQPFVRKRDVRNGDDADMSREPETVQAYRDTWELGLHSYLPYLRDRFTLSRDLLADSGSLFVQISDENLHLVRKLLDEVFGSENFGSIIPFAKTASTATDLLSEEFDYLLWYAKDRSRTKYRQIYLPKVGGTFVSYKYAVSPGASDVRMASAEERENPGLLADGWRLAQLSFAVSQQAGDPAKRHYTFDGKTYDCGANRHWKARNPEGLDRLAAANRLIGLASQLNYIRYLDDFPATTLTNLWSDTGSAGYSNRDPKLYVVQTDTNIVQRCILMTTDPGDLVVDPTCGSGTTAYVAEQWGRRWITADVSRVPLALARQRLLTATFPLF